jgi:hypothetical protein
MRIPPGTGLGGPQRVSSTPPGRAAKLHAYGNWPTPPPPHPPPFLAIHLGLGGGVRQALAGEGGWSTVRFLVANASPALGYGQADTARLPLGHTRPRRPLIELTDLDARMPQPTGPTD